MRSPEPPSTLLPTAAVAKLLDLHPQTLRLWRVRGGGPDYVKIGARVRYDLADVRTWIDLNKHASTAAAASKRGAR